MPLAQVALMLQKVFRDNSIPRLKPYPEFSSEDASQHISWQQPLSEAFPINIPFEFPCVHLHLGTLPGRETGLPAAGEGFLLAVPSPWNIPSAAPQLQLCDASSLRAQLLPRRS